MLFRFIFSLKGDLNYNFGLKILLCKPDLLIDFFFAERKIFRTNHPFIFYIVKPVNYCDNFSVELFDGFINAQNIRVLLFSVGSDNALDISVIYGIHHILMLRVAASKRSVNSNRNYISYHFSHLK